MRQFNKITIIGVGLIGGSIALAAKKKGLAKQIVGVCRHTQSLRRARKLGAIDQGTLDWRKAVENADLVILAAPIYQIIQIAERIAPHLKDNCLVCDAGSTKSEIVSRLERALSSKACFVGAHPLAGSEKRGVGAARSDLFKNSLCLITRTKGTNPGALRKISALWRKLGCRIQIISPQGHDRAAALISHLPHLAALGLIKVARGSLNFAAKGFLDTTRIASSDAEIWTDIFLSNRWAVAKALDHYIRYLKQLRRLVVRKNRGKLNSEFKTAKRLRDALQK